MENLKILCIDLGTCFIKAGFHGTEKPSLIMPSTISYNTNESPVKIITGYEALVQTSDFQTYSLYNEYDKQFRVNRVDGFTYLMNHIIEQISLAGDFPEALIVCVPPEVDMNDILSIVEMLKYNISPQVPAIEVLMSTATINRMSGYPNSLFVDIGERVTRIIPILDRLVKLPLGIFLPRGGKFLSDYLSKMIYDRHYFVLNEYAIHDVKKNHCRLSQSRIGSKGPNLNQEDIITYIIPNTDSEITLDKELLLCPEAMFNPCLFDQDKEAIGLQDAIYNCIMNVPQKYREELFSHLTVFGGSTMFPNFAERLTQELTDLAPVDMNISVLTKGWDGFDFVWTSLSTDRQDQFINTMDDVEYDNYNVLWVKEGGLICEDKPIISDSYY